MLLHYIRRAFTLPPHIAAAKAWRIFRRYYLQRALWVKQRLCASFHKPTPSSRLVQCFDSFDFTLSPSDMRALQFTTGNALENRFDLLGSGWVRVEHGADCAGVEGHHYPPDPKVETDPRGHWLRGRINRSNLAGANQRWQLIQGDHRAVDWQLDFKTGYRWSEKDWGQTTQVAPRPGVDIKVPWELGRLQHLPQLALAYAAVTQTKDGSPLASPETYALAFQNQLLDFLATNPPGWGVNWHCTMDVAIRISNVLLAWNIFRVYGMTFRDEFEAVLFAAAKEHGEHIANHIEWAEFGRGNHYLCNLVGLIFSAAYLSSDHRSEQWLAYGYWGLLREVKRQFHEDGGNFEASIGYHRLSSEAVAFATAVILGLPEEQRSRMLTVPKQDLRHLPGVAERTQGVSASRPFPGWYVKRLAGMAQFSRATLRPDGRIPQFGDNDNGRIVKLIAAMNADEPGATEDILDHSSLASEIEALFERHCVSVPQTNTEPSAALLRGLARDKHLGPVETDTEEASSPFTSLSDFGLFIWKRNRIWLALRCGPNGQDGLGGHAHNDQLSIELCVDGLPFVIDPGTYLYTADPEWRNRFRSTGVHNTLAVDGLEQSDWFPQLRGLFLLTDQAHASPLWYDETSFLGEHFGFDVSHRRSVTIADTVCQFTDTCGTTAGKKIGLTLHPDVDIEATSESAGMLLRRGSTTVEFACVGHEISTVECWWSPGYGQRIKTRRVEVRSNATQFDWTLTVL